MSKLFSNLSYQAKVPKLDSSRRYTTYRSDIIVTNDTITGNYSLWKNPVRVATTANIDILQNLIAVDGVTVATGDRILVKNQTNGVENGIYSASADLWKRAEDFLAGTIQDGAIIYVQEGSTQATKFYASFEDTAVVGTDSITFTNLDSVGLTLPGEDTSILMSDGASGFLGYDSFKFDASTSTITIATNAADDSVIRATGGSLTLSNGAATVPGSITLSTVDYDGSATARSVNLTTQRTTGGTNDINLTGTNINVTVPTASFVAAAATASTSLQELIGVPTSTADRQGTSVSISKDGLYAAVGAPGVLGGTDDGLVFIFNKTGTAWSQQTVLSALITQSRFGTNVALDSDGNTLVVHLGGNDISGALYVFTRSASTWSRQQIIEPSFITGVGNDFDYGSLAISDDGNVVSLGRVNNNNDGKAWLFKRNSGTWTERLYIVGDATSDSVGASVSLNDDGSIFAVANRGPGPSLPDPGKVIIYTSSDLDSWTQRDIIAVSTSSEIKFGTSCSLNSDGDEIAIGAPFDGTGGTNVGVTYVFNYASSVWTQTAKLLGTDPGTAESKQGTSVSLKNDNLVIGGPGYSPNGAIWKFEKQDGVWTETAIVAPSLGAAALLGTSVDIDDNAIAIAGAPADDSGQGTTQIFGPLKNGIVLSGTTVNFIPNTGYPIIFNGTSITLTKDALTYSGSFSSQARQGIITISSSVTVDPQDYTTISLSNSTYYSSSKIMMANLQKFSGSVVPILSTNISGTNIVFIFYNPDSSTTINLQGTEMGFVIF